jgi:hypothetical protein
VNYIAASLINELGTTCYLAGKPQSSTAGGIELKPMKSVMTTPLKGIVPDFQKTKIKINTIKLIVNFHMQ